MSINTASFINRRTPLFFILLHFDMIRIIASKKTCVGKGYKSNLANTQSKSSSRCAYTSSYLFSSGMENSIFLFSVATFTYLKTDIVLVSLSALTLLISSDYFAMRLDSSGFFYMILLVCFRCNLFCTVSSCSLLQCRVIRADVSTHLEYFAELEIQEPKIMFSARDAIAIILNVCLPVEPDSCLFGPLGGPGAALFQSCPP